MGWVLSFTGKTTDLLKLFIFYSAYKCAGQCSERWHRSREMKGKNVLLSNGMTWVWTLGLFNPGSHMILGKYSSNWMWLGTRWMPSMLHLVFYNLSDNIRWVLLASPVLRCGNISLRERNEFDPQCALGVEETHAPAREHRALYNHIRELASRSSTFLSWDFSHLHNEAVELDADFFFCHLERGCLYNYHH